MIDQTLSSSRVKLARLAYRSPPPPEPPDAAEPLARQLQPSMQHKPQKRARSPSPQPTTRVPAVEQPANDDGFDDLLDFDLGDDGVADGEPSVPEPLFHPASPTTLTPEQDMASGDDDDGLLVDGRLNLDSLLDFDRAPEAATSAAPARKRARYLTGAVQVDSGQQQRPAAG